MPYSVRIRTLEESSRLIEHQISNIEKDEVPDRDKIDVLKNKKTELINEIRRLRRLQWEEEHERIRLDDDR